MTAMKMEEKNVHTSIDLLKAKDTSTQKVYNDHDNHSNGIALWSLQLSGANPDIRNLSS